jgi:hypothetical protein
MNETLRGSSRFFVFFCLFLSIITILLGGVFYYFCVLIFLSCFSIVWHELDGLDRWMDVRAFFFMNEMDIGFGFRFGGGIISFVFLRRKK